MEKHRRLHITEVDYHRNGIGGHGFFAVRFTDPKNGAMLAVVFMNVDEDGYSIPFPDPMVAVFHEETLPVITFGTNSWRGDNYAGELYEAIQEYERRKQVGACPRTCYNPPQI